MARTKCKVIDRRGREVERADGILLDGDRAVVPMFMLDGVQRAVAEDAARRAAADARRYGLYPLGGTSKEGDVCSIDGRPGRLRRVEGGYECVADASSDSISITTDAPTVVVDAFGDSSLAAMSRPGARYLHSGHRTVDHAAQVTREVNVRDARAASIRETAEAWKGGGGNTYEVERRHSTGDSLADAYLDQVHDLTTSWAKGSGRR